MNRIQRIKLAVLFAPAGMTSVVAAWAGDLNPPVGPVAPTMKSLDIVEPRIAINAANTPGDADSLFKITQAGSYYLTRNVTGAVGKHGIEIAASGVTLDLSGFELLGSVGSLDGVTTTLAGATNTKVYNGSIRSWGGDGVDLGSAPCVASRLHDLVCIENAGAGIRTGFIAIVSACIAHGNAGEGFVIASSTRITECTASLNGGVGIYGGGKCTIADCLMEQNTNDGVRVSGDCTLHDNTCIANGNNGDGAGIHLSGSGSRVVGNQCSDNDSEIDSDAGGNFIVRNTCSGNTINFFLASNNVYGPIVNRTVPASPNVSGSSAASTLGSTDANANFSY